MSSNECLITLLDMWLTYTSHLLKLDLQYHQQMRKKCDTFEISVYTHMKIKKREKTFNKALNQKSG